MTKRTPGDWSTTASANTSVDGNNIDENCPMSTLNNGERAIMAAVAGYSQVVAASTLDGGATYTATLAPAPDALNNAQTYFVNFATANSGAGTTLNLNGLGAKTIVYGDGSTALLAGALNGDHILRYDGVSLRVLNPAKITGAPPTGNAGGDLSGTYPNPTVSKILGVSAGTALRGFIDGFETSAPGGGQILFINAGAAVDNANAVFLTVTANYTKTMSAWAVGSTLGGLDTGTVQVSTAYFVWIIQRADTGVVDYLISLSGTAPTMPTNYAIKRGPIAWFKTDGSSNIWQFQQRGDEFLYGTMVHDVNGASTTSVSRTLYALSVPSGFVVTALIRASLNSTVTTNDPVLITSPDETDQAVGGTSGPGDVNSSSNGVVNLYGNAALAKRTNTSAQIGARTGTAGETFHIWTYGFQWARGRNN